MEAGHPLEPDPQLPTVCVVVSSSTTVVSNGLQNCAVERVFVVEVLWLWLWGNGCVIVVVVGVWLCDWGCSCGLWFVVVVVVVVVAMVVVRVVVVVGVVVVWCVVERVYLIVRDRDSCQRLSLHAQ